MAKAVFIETGAGGGTVLPGHPRQRFVMHVNEDGAFCSRMPSR